MDDLNALPTTMVIYRVLGIRNNLKGTWKSLQWKMRIYHSYLPRKMASFCPTGLGGSASDMEMELWAVCVLPDWWGQ